MKLLILFIVLNVLNVIIQTAKSIVTIKCGKMAAALTNALAYGLYTVVIVYMVCDLPLWQKVVIVALANFFGVYTVKWFEQKSRKDKLWKIECAVKGKEKMLKLGKELLEQDVSYNFTKNLSDEYYTLNCFSKTQADSLAIKKILDKYNVKYFIIESKMPSL